MRRRYVTGQHSADHANLVGLDQPLREPSFVSVHLARSLTPVSASLLQMLRHLQAHWRYMIGRYIARDEHGRHRIPDPRRPSCRLVPAILSELAKGTAGTSLSEATSRSGARVPSLFVDAKYHDRCVHCRCPKPMDMARPILARLTSQLKAYLIDYRSR